MKRVMLLGGNYFQMTAIKAAKELGYYVISVDYLPDNPGHKFADEYHNVSTIDKEEVLALAREKEIHGIVSYASDVSAPTAAYVATQLGLPTNPIESVEILTDKQLFRKFLVSNGFNAPKGSCFSDFEAAKRFCESTVMPVVIKPTDSCGSKGVHKIQSSDEMEDAWNDAVKYSRNKKIFVEDFLEKDGYEIDADSFLVDGEIAYFGVMDQHNDLSCNPYVPIGLSGPSVLSSQRRQTAKKELQRLMSLLNMKIGAFNIEYIFDKYGDLYILEVGPRNGGNLITDTIKEGTGIDLAKYTIMAAVGEPCTSLKEKPFHTCVSSYIIHSDVDGKFQGLSISEDMQDDILRLDMFVKPGDDIYRFNNASFGIGAAIIKFPDINTMDQRMDNMGRYIQVRVDRASCKET